MVNSNAEMHTNVFRLCSLALLQGLTMLCLFHLFAKSEVQVNEVKPSLPQEIFSLEFQSAQEDETSAYINSIISNNKDIALINSDYLSKEEGFSQLLANVRSLQAESVIPDDNPFRDLMKLHIEGSKEAINRLKSVLKADATIFQVKSIALASKSHKGKSRATTSQVSMIYVILACSLFTLFMIILIRLEIKGILKSTGPQLESLRRYGASLKRTRDTAFGRGTTNVFVVWIGGVALFLLLIHLFHNGMGALMTDISAQELFLVLILPLVVYWITQLILKNILFNKLYST